MIKQAEISFSDLDLIVCSKGPGSFTGLRIGMSTAKGISTGSRTPIVSVNILDAYAHGLEFFSGAVVPVIDARKNRFYSAVYKNGERISDYLDISAQELSSRLSTSESVLITGSGCSLIRASFTDKPYKYFTFNNNLAEKMTDLGIKIFNERGPDADDAGPFYIRKSDAEILKK